MIVCSCQCVSQDVVEAAIADGARDTSAVSAMCGAGAGCGGCCHAIEALLAQAARNGVRHFAS